MITRISSVNSFYRPVFKGNPQVSQPIENKSIPNVKDNFTREVAKRNLIKGKSYGKDYEIHITHSNGDTKLNGQIGGQEVAVTRTMTNLLTSSYKIEGHIGDKSLDLEENSLLKLTLKGKFGEEDIDLQREHGWHDDTFIGKGVDMSLMYYNKPFSFVPVTKFVGKYEADTDLIPILSAFYQPNSAFLNLAS